MLFSRKPLALPTAETALPGRARPIPTASVHYVSGLPLEAEAPAGFETAVFGLGCFWGAERLFCLGRRAPVLADPGRVADPCRLCRRPHAQPDL